MNNKKEESTSTISVEALNYFYKGLHELIGEQAMLKVYEEYHGTQLTLPSHMYERNAAAKLVRKEYDGTNSVELSHKYGYSQKWVMRQIRNI